MKISEVTMETVAAHVRTAADDQLLEVYWDAAVKSVLSYTGLDNVTADKYDDLTVAALVITSEMYDNRQMQVESDKVSKVVEGFIGLHDHNLLPGEDVTP